MKCYFVIEFGEKPMTGDSIQAALRFVAKEGAWDCVAPVEGSWFHVILPQRRDGADFMYMHLIPGEGDETATAPQ